MLKLLSHLRAARLFLRCQPYVDLPGGFWTRDDAAAWLAFRQSPAGRKLGLLLANQVARSAVAATAVSDPTRAAHECGYASGIRGTVTILDALLPSASAEPPHPFPTAGPQSGNSGQAPFQQGNGHPLAHLQP